MARRSYGGWETRIRWVGCRLRRAPVVASGLVVGLLVVAVAVGVDDENAARPVVVPPAPGSTALVRPPAAAIDRDCDIVDVGDPLDLIDELVRSDATCGPPAATDRLCRALAAITLTDPVVYAAADPSQLDRAVAAHLWATDELTLAAGALGLPSAVDTATALARPWTSSALADLTSADLGAIAIDRSADPVVVDGLRRAEERCAAGS